MRGRLSPPVATFCLKGKLGEIASLSGNSGNFAEKSRSRFSVSAHFGIGTQSVMAGSRPAGRPGHDAFVAGGFVGALPEDLLEERERV
jgi:hypothetical protein